VHESDVALPPASAKHAKRKDPSKRKKDKGRKKDRGVRHAVRPVLAAVGGILVGVLAMAVLGRASTPDRGFPLG
jgi:hypothetical protein